MGKRVALAGIVASFALTSTACGFGQVIESGPENAGAPPIKDELDGDVEAGEPPREDEYVVPSIVPYTDTITLIEDADPYKAERYVFVDHHTSVTYASDNEAVFKVDEIGTIIPVAPGVATLKIAAFGEGGGETVKELKVVIREIWSPTDPITKEAVEIMRNKDLVKTEVIFFDKQFEMDGPVDTGANRLQMYFYVGCEGEKAFDVSAGFGGQDYDISFKIYLREKNTENDRTDYKVIHTNLVPFAIHELGSQNLCRCLFYDSGLLDLVQAGKSYDTVVVIYKGDKAVAWSQAALEWTETSALFVELAKQDEGIIK